MKYEVKYDPKAEKQLEKLPKEIVRRIVRKLHEVGETGRGLETLRDTIYGYKIRVGDHRVLVDITHSPGTIWVRYIGHRSTVYKRI